MTDIETQKQIYDKLRAHPKGPRELVMLARSIPGQDRLDAVRQAQSMVVDYVLEVHGGDVERFLDAYDNGNIRPQDLITYAGRKALGFQLSSLTPPSVK